MPTIDEIQAANNQELELMQKERHRLRTENQKQAQVIVEQAEIIKGFREGSREIIEHIRELID